MNIPAAETVVRRVGSGQRTTIPTAYWIVQTPLFLLTLLFRSRPTKQIYQAVLHVAAISRAGMDLQKRTN
ncbi:MAG: hypothetical protein JXR73_04530 [Candidatus Omnitrophica bacterium]|nr:hypothetical protein [Candidatus Omnitrophota bacterium]